MMLKKIYRLNLSNPQNSEILEKGKSDFFSSKYFLIYSRSNDVHLRLTVVVPKKVFSKATARNKHRRLIYSLIEEIFLEKKIDFSTLKKDYLFILKRRKFPDEKEELKQVLKADLDQFFSRVL